MTTATNIIDDETTITEITVQPDGRVYVFGTSRHVLDILLSLNPASPSLNELIHHVRAIETAATELETEIRRSE